MRRYTYKDGSPTRRCCACKKIGWFKHPEQDLYYCDEHMAEDDVDLGMCVVDIDEEKSDH